MTKQRLTNLFNQRLRLFALALVFLASSWLASKAETIAVSIPRSGDFSEIGRQFEIGATLAMEKFGQGHELFIADDGCDLDQSMLAAQDMRSKNPAIVAGMLCNITAATVADELREDKTPLLVAGARSIRLIKDRDREEWNLWRMSPGDDAPADTIAAYIINNLKDTPFALVDDGTIYGRSLTDAIRLRLNDSGMKPQFADSFRAAQSTQSGMLRRLERSGVEVAFIAAATPEDLLTIAKDHNSLGIKTKLIVSEQLASLPYLEEAGLVKDGLMIVMQTRFEKNEALRELLKERNIEPSKALYEGYAALEVAIAALGNTTQETTQNLASKEFGSVLGPVQFDNQGKNLHNSYELFIWREDTFERLDGSNNL
jgi:branched-chain amino acid transport system substrate-binding protein